MMQEIGTSSSQKSSNTNFLDLKAPLSGKIVPLAQVPDPVFAEKMMGDGIGIEPSNDAFYAPCSGRVVQLHSASHALTIETPEGFQVLGHIGLDTVTLKGKGFNPLVKVGDQVILGQKLISFDPSLIRAAGLPLTSVMVVLNESLKDASVSVNSNTNVEHNQATLMRVAYRTQTDERSVQKSEAGAMLSHSLFLSLPTGMHARPAARLVKLANESQAELFLVKGDRSASLKSVVDILSLEIGSDDELKVKALGVHAEQAIAKVLSELILIEKSEQAKGASEAVVEEAKEETPQILAEGSYKAVSASPGQVVGKVKQLAQQKFEIHQKGESPAAESQRLKAALQEADRELAQMEASINKAQDKEIFAAHRSLLQDQALLKATESGIAQGLSAAYSWDMVIEANTAQLEALQNKLLAARANDLKDVGQRVLMHLFGGQDNVEQDLAGAIIIAENLTPSQTLKLGQAKVLGFCSTHGGKTSHVAILARSLGIPCLVGAPVEVLSIANGEEVILDGDHGLIKRNPTSAEKTQVQKLYQAQQVIRENSKREAHKPATTLDGVTIEVASNINNASDVEMGLGGGQDGVGLLRTEFLFLERLSAPSMEEQTNIYQQIADAVGEKPLVVRTLDIGGDKPVKYLSLPAEENPFLGIRGIRLSLKHEAHFREQLQSIFKVKSKAKLHVMFPMIGLWEEWVKAKQIFDEELANTGRTDVKVGMMVEVPSAAIMAKVFAPHVDFFSIGTNDLTQYTLAMDRGNQALADQVDGLHPAVLTLIHQTVEAAHAHGKWVGVCGGIAGDNEAVPVLLGLGVDELSVSSPSVPLIKSRIRELNFKTCQTMAQKALTLSNGKEVRQLVGEL